MRGRHLDGLDDDDADALRVFGIDLDDVTARIDGHRPGGRSGRTPRLSRPAKRALELSLRAAVRLRDAHIGTEHLLLGLARCGDRVVDDVLTAHAVGAEVLEQVVTAGVRRAG